MTVTRFAPSPTGHLHPGHAYSAAFAHDIAQREDGQFLLRIEDIDPVRCKAGLADDLVEDLRWLSLSWTEPVRYQSQHLDDYRHALGQLLKSGLVYPCFCTRKEIAAEAAASAGAPHVSGADGPTYPGTCRGLPEAEATARMRDGVGYSWRLDVARAREQVGALTWRDRKRGTIAATPEMFGDVVLARKDVPTSYHLSVTVDDHLQGVTLVTRGEDLFTATHIHRLLQALLGYAVPEYEHHGLVLDACGKRFAKRDRSVTLRALRTAGKTPADIWAMVGRT
jgi:glutamyl-Q tRNA(Asp) synthetase